MTNPPIRKKSASRFRVDYKIKQIKLPLELGTRLERCAAEQVENEGTILRQALRRYLDEHEAWIRTRASQGLV